ncbi:MAG: hypothetical protein AAFS11_03985 [Planctomycetota bacterium]
MRTFVLSLVCVVLTLQAPAQPVGSLDPGSLQRFTDGHRAWQAERLWSAWERDPGRVAAADEQARVVFDHAAAQWATMEFAGQSRPNAQTRLEAVEQAMALAPESRVLALLLGQAMGSVGIDDRLPEAVAAFRTASASTDLPFRTALLAARLNRMARASGDEALRAETERVAFEQFGAGLLDLPADAMQQRYAARSAALVASWSDAELDFADRAEQAAQRAPDPWVALIAAATAHEDIAWRVRGRGYSSKVAPDAWPIFRERIDRALAVAERAHGLRPASPEAAGLMVALLKADAAPQREIDAWFDRTVQAQQTWMPAIDEYAWAVRPRWGGSIERMEDLALWLATHATPENELGVFLFTLVELIGEDIGSHRGVWSRNRPLARAASTALRAQLEAGVRESSSRSRLLGIAWATRDWATCAEFIDRVSHSTFGSLRRFRVHEEDIRDEMLLLGPGAPAPVRNAVRAARRVPSQNAAARLEEMANDASLAAELRSALRHAAVATAWHVGFEDGETITLGADGSLAGWRVWMGDAEAHDGGVRITDALRGAWIRPAFDPGRRYELRTSVRAPDGEGRAWSRLILGKKWDSPDRFWHTVSMRWHDALIRMRYQFGSRRSEAIEGPLADGVVDLRVVCFDGDLLVEADGVVVYRGPLAMGFNYIPGTGIWLSARIDGEGRRTSFGPI